MPSRHGDRFLRASVQSMTTEPAQACHLTEAALSGEDKFLEGAALMKPACGCLSSDPESGSVLASGKAQLG